MAAKIIDGKAIAAQINQETAQIAAELAKKAGRKVGLAVVLVGDDPASAVYVRNKVRACAETGIESRMIAMPKESTTEDVLKVIAELNADDTIDGILVQSPPPPQVDEAAVILAIDPDKDVDCFAERNVGRLLIGEKSGFHPCTPWGVMELLKRSGIDPKGKHAVVIGRSNIVGKPMAALLMQKAAGANATVTVVHSGTPDIRRYTLDADILVAAIGKPEFVKGDMIKDGAVVIDVGINRIFDEELGKNRLVGDVKYAEAAEKASFITPVPGGVGPMTIAGLLRNACIALQLKLEK
ncbi:MAG: bifunctional methylenetetrahydrofolate dehydrogenase/methenyltetrahydrofolate cyclohydrolase FolD [Lentisphaerae bacterium]|nr:bifunctional methylenetetrahydrofolate dehydrogenase/methenyltetrahydrofolate cyclohydrolase FolD [Lentisphaerota bacterium]MBR2720744.1 bifunctional methylenetetrahydrofolate dehydrogenase/methenyltetrahydrofolate cyclohydrolase FolD [Lentisphaeria bacterium]